MWNHSNTNHCDKASFNGSPLSSCCATRIHSMNITRCMLCHVCTFIRQLQHHQTLMNPVAPITGMCCCQATTEQSQDSRCPIISVLKPHADPGTYPSSISDGRVSGTYPTSMRRCISTSPFSSLSTVINTYSTAAYPTLACRGAVQALDGCSGSRVCRVVSMVANQQQFASEFNKSGTKQRVTIAMQCSNLLLQTRHLRVQLSRRSATVLYSLTCVEYRGPTGITILPPLASFSNSGWCSSSAAAPTCTASKGSS